MTRVAFFCNIRGDDLMSRVFQRRGGLVFFSCWQLKTRRRAKIGVTIERFWIKNDGFSILRRRFPFYGRGKRGFFDSKAKVSFLWARKFVQLLWRYDCLQPQSFSKHFRLAVAKEPRVGLSLLAPGVLPPIRPEPIRGWKIKTRLINGYIACE